MWPVVLVGVIWGLTNVLMKRYSTGSTIKYAICFISNLLGSALYYRSLKDTSKTRTPISGDQL